MKQRTNLILAAKLILIPVSLFYYVACSPVKFEKESISPDCSSNGTCIVSPDFIDYSESITVTGPKVDILFVNDNSGSMSFEQSKLAERFDTFIQALDQKSVDYRIGMVTTDVSVTNTASALFNPARAINKNGALQDGKLIAFRTATEESQNQAGVAYLTPSSPLKFDRFANTISRKETKQCENFITSTPANSPTPETFEANRRINCPSGDERGIAAANLFIKNQSQNMLRSDSQLAIIFLSDEDVNSSAYYKSNSYRLSADDLPSSIISNVTSKFPGKQLSMHSIIVKPGQLNSGVSANSLEQALNSTVSSSLKPEVTYYSGADTSCLSQQSTQTKNTSGLSAFSGSYGFMYDIASRLTGGVVGDICANDYGSQLDEIGRDIGERISQITLKCSAPLNVDVQFSPISAARSFNLNGSRVEFSGDLAIGTKVQVKYSCRRAG